MAHQSTILIVDDQPAGRDTLEALLFAEDYVLVFAANGPEALAQAAEHKPDVILLDVMMPGMDGFEVCRRLRSDPLLAEVPAIMVTALDDRDSRVEGIEAGADDFISKPFDRMELRARIRTISRLNRYRRLLSERARFEWVIEQADDGYLIVGDGDAVVYANIQARNYLSLPVGLAEPVVEPFLTLVAKAHYHCNPQEAWQSWSQRTIDSPPLYMVQPASATSEAFWLQVDRMAMEGTGNDQKYLVRLRDVTASLAERRAQWVFHAQVGHKLRTPLSLLDGFLDYFLEYEEDMSATEKDSLRSKMRHSSHLLKKNILDIFEYVNAQDAERLRQNLCHLAEISEIVTKVRHKLELTSLHIVSPAVNGTGTNDILPLSYQSIEMIMTELLENALKFHPQKAPTLEVKISKLSDGVCVRVIDDGVTLTAEQLAKIWVAYYQAEAGFSGQVPGMGLGLSTVASIIWGAGGDCRAYNRPEGNGLVVEFSVPFIDEDEV